MKCVSFWALHTLVFWSFLTMLACPDTQKWRALLFGCCCSVAKSCPALHNPMDGSGSSLFPGVCSNSCPLSQWCHLILCCLLLPSIFPSIRVFSNESALHIRWPKYWSFSCSISHSNEYSGLISFRTGWFDLLAVQGTLESLLQHHSSKESLFRRSAFFMVQLSHPY